MFEFKNGTYKLLEIKYDGIFYPIGCLTSNSFNEKSDTLETTTRENEGGWKTSIPTNQSYNISFSGLSTKTDKGNTIIPYYVLKEFKRDKTRVEWKIRSEREGYFETGFGYITSLSDSAEIDSFISFNGEMQGYAKPITSKTNQLTLTLNAKI